MSRAWPAAGLVLIVGLGCGNAGAPQQSKTVGSAPPVPVVAAAAPAAQPPAPAAGGQAPAGADLPAERKIVFTGVLEVVVKDFTAARTELDSLLRKYKGYYAKTEITGDSGKKRSATFTIKVPVEGFQSLVDELAAMGDPVRNATDSQDVTEEYVDVAARVKNLKAEEEVLNKLLKDAAGRLDDVFKIREQIRQVRGDIERAEGRMLALGKMAALSTVTLTLRELEPYVALTVPKPSDPPPPPAFETRATGTFAASWGLLVEVVQAVALFAVAIAPWLPLIVVGAVLLRWLVKRMAARSGVPAKPEPEPRRARRVLPAAPVEPQQAAEPPNADEPPAT